jgi:hypothetical protein
MLIFNTVKTSYFIETKSIYFGQCGTHYIILFNLNLFQVTGSISSFFSRAKEYWAVLNQLSLQEINRHDHKSDSFKSRLNNHSML